MVLKGWTSRVIYGWLWIEEAAMGMIGHTIAMEGQWSDDSVVIADNNSAVADHIKTNEGDNLELSTPLNDALDESEISGNVDCHPLSSLPLRHRSNYERINGVRRTSRIRRFLQNLTLLILGTAMIGYYAFVHLHVIQKEDQVFITTWFYEWFIIPVLISFAFCAPLHRALGRLRFGGNVTNDGATSHQQSLQNSYETQEQHEQELHRIKLLERDPATQRLIVAVAVCYAVYIVGDASFFIPLSPSHTHFSTYIVYLLAVLTNMAFIYQGFLLAILTMRVMVVRLHELKAQVDVALQEMTIATTPCHTTEIQTSIKRSTTTTNATAETNISRQQLLLWIQSYQELRQDMQSLSRHFGLRMVLGITMFVVEVSNMILNVWEAIGSSLTRLQTVLLLLMYTANAAILIIVTFQTASTVTLCTERIGPCIALLSLRTSNSPDRAGELNVLAQTFMQAPIRLRAGNFHITVEYANTLTAWFFGLFLVVFGMKLPKI